MAQGCRGVRGEEGAALVEFALASVILFMTLFGIIGVCLALYTFNFVSDAAREGTRWAVVRGSSCTVLSDCNATAAEVQSYVQSLGYPGMNASNLTVTTAWCAAGASAPAAWATCSASTPETPGNQVQVKVTYAFPLTVPFWKLTILSISSTSQMVIAN